MSWIIHNWLWGLSIVIMLASAGLDGRYIRSWMFTGWVGAICGYGLNLAVDICAEVFAYEYTLHILDVQAGKARDKKRAHARWLLVGQFGLIYFGVVFSWRQLSLVLPDEPSWLLWSAAAFAQFALVFLGIAQALRDGTGTRAKGSDRTATGSDGGRSESDGIADDSTVNRYQCGKCKARFATQNALNSHMSVHKREKSKNERGRSVAG